MSGSWRSEEATLGIVDLRGVGPDVGFIGVGGPSSKVFNKGFCEALAGCGCGSSYMERVGRVLMCGVSGLC